MLSDQEYWDNLSEAAAEIRDAIEQRFSEGAIDALKQRFHKMRDLTPEQENSLEEQARENYLEEKHKKGLVECKFCGYEHSKDFACSECERQLADYDKER